ncbi:MAG: hypothetical protein M3Z24_09460 [Chloroflexota bacterium]|nr:hypothetical protein [Chloroflexota bacterium]
MSPHQGKRKVNFTVIIQPFVETVCISPHQGKRKAPTTTPNRPLPLQKTAGNQLYRMGCLGSPPHINRCGSLRPSEAAKPQPVGS